MDDNLAVTTETPAAPPAVTPSITITEPAAPAAPESRRDTIERAFKTPTNRGKHASLQPREQGRFAGAPQVGGAVAAPAPVVERPPLSKSLKRELEPHWNAAPHELVTAFAQREADYEKGVEPLKTKSAQYDQLMQQFQPYEQMLQAEGATPATAISSLLGTAALLRTGTPAQKAQGLAQVMRQHNIPLDHIAAVFGQTQSPVFDPQFNALAQQVQQLTQAQQAQSHAQQQRALSVIESFSSDPANSHFAALQPKMLALLQQPDIFGKDISLMSEREKLKLAYDTALRLDPELSAQASAAIQGQQAAVSAAKTAAVQVRGAPGASIPADANPKDRRAVIANALRAAQR